jgi:hypothetical protein
MATNWVKMVVAMFLLLASFSAVAAEGTGKVTVPSAVQLNGKKIDAGEYKISWTGKDNDVQVTFMAGKDVVMTAPAKLVENQTAPAYSFVGRDKDGGLTGIWLQGKKTVLMFAR